MTGLIKCGFVLLERKAKVAKNKDIPEKMLKKVCAEVLCLLRSLMRTIFAEQIEKIVVNAQDELIFYFYDGQSSSTEMEIHSQEGLVDAGSKSSKIRLQQKEPSQFRKHHLLYLQNRLQ